MRVVAIGGRDELSAARDFIRRHALRTPILTFDNDDKVWAAYRVNAQPTAILLDRTGTEQAHWFGALNDRDVLNAAQRADAASLPRQR